MSRHITLCIPLIVFFLVVNVLCYQYGGTNEASRFATLRSISDRMSFSIDPIVNWTVDWSHNQEKQYYSNKAPGPVLIGAPLFLLFDAVAVHFADIRVQFWDAKRIRIDYPSQFFRTIYAFLMQTVPFALLCLFALQIYEREHVAPAAVLFSLIGMLFGHTAALFMNTFFGHAFAACTVLACGISLYLGHWRAVGLFFGLMVLSEYSLIVYLPALIVLFARDPKLYKTRAWACLVGASAPALLWIWYHTVCFGSPFHIAYEFQNPIFLDMKESPGGVLGMLSFTFHASYIYELLMGAKRGILFTQPWLFIAFLVSVSFVLSQKGPLKDLAFFASTGMLGLFLINQSMTSWHAGYSAGPRYLSAGIPLFFFLLAVGWKHIQLSLVKYSLIGGLVVSLLLYSIILAAGLLAPPDQALWKWAWNMAIDSDIRKPWYAGLTRSVVFLLELAFLVWRISASRNEVR